MGGSFYTRFCERFDLQLPIVQAGMAGNITSPELVAAVSEAGGLGTLGAAYMTPDALRQAIRRIKELTKRPFSVNLLLYQVPEQPEQISPELIEWINQMRAEVGLAAWDGKLRSSNDSLDECFQVILDERVPVFSVAFSLPGKYGEAAKVAGSQLIGMATTLDEAIALAAQGVDAIVVQGGEAGGHRGTFSVKAGSNGETIGTLPLVSLVAEHLPDVPIIAAGGIMDGRGLVAALALGADGVQLGTRFLACRESLAHPAYKARLLQAKETDPQITRSFSGRPARGIANRIMNSFEERRIEALPYPLQSQLTGEIRVAAAAQHNADYMLLLAGQGVAMLPETNETAKHIVNEIMQQAEAAIQRFR